MCIVKPLPDFGQSRMIDIQHHQNADSHENQCSGKQRIYLSYNLIDGKQCGQNVIYKDNCNPERHVQIVGSKLGKQTCRGGYKTAPTSIMSITVKTRITCLVVSPR